MQRIVLLLSILVVFSIQVKGQKGNDFNIAIPDLKIGDNKYNGIRYIESRSYPDDMGFAYEGMWNGVRPVMLREPLDVQIQSLVEGVTIPSDEPKTMAVQMRALFFSLGEGDRRGKGLCNLRMTVYAMDSNEKYYFLNTIDTLLIADQKKIKATVGETISSFIIGNLPYLSEEGESALGIDEVMDIDFYERNSIPLYTAEKLPDGIYKNYKSLKNLTPDISSSITIAIGKNGKFKEVKVADSEKPGKDKKLKSKDIYAVVLKGVVYISFDGDFYEAYRKEGDWRFVITRKVAGSGFSLGVSVGSSGSRGGGAVGFGIPIGTKKENIEMFIDHLNGDFHWGAKVMKNN